MHRHPTRPYYLSRLLFLLPLRPFISQRNHKRTACNQKHLPTGAQEERHSNARATARLQRAILSLVQSGSENYASLPFCKPFVSWYVHSNHLSGLQPKSSKARLIRFRLSEAWSDRGKLRKLNVNSSSKHGNRERSSLHVSRLA